MGFPRADQGGLTINPEGRIPLVTEIAANRGVAAMVRCQTVQSTNSVRQMGWTAPTASACHSTGRENL